MTGQHRGRIHWSAEQVRRGLPSALRLVDPVWDAQDTTEGWSLICEFAVSPIEQGNPSLATVSFLFDTAPMEWLCAGRELQLFERGTGMRAAVEILD